jgi:hypothetical protein
MPKLRWFKSQRSLWHAARVFLWMLKRRCTTGGWSARCSSQTICQSRISRGECVLMCCVLTFCALRPVCSRSDDVQLQVKCAIMLACATPERQHRTSELQVPSAPGSGTAAGANHRQRHEAAGHAGAAHAAAGGCDRWRGRRHCDGVPTAGCRRFLWCTRGSSAGTRPRPDAGAALVSLRGDHVYGVVTAQPAAARQGQGNAHAAVINGLQC